MEAALKLIGRTVVLVVLVLVSRAGVAYVSESLSHRHRAGDIPGFLLKLCDKSFRGKIVLPLPRVA